MQKQTKKISLSPASIQQVIAICNHAAVHSKPEFVDMAVGIGDWVKSKGYLCEKQAMQVCRNADFSKMKRPPELANLVVKEPGKAPAQTRASIVFEPEDDWHQEVAKHYLALAKLFEQRTCPF